MKGSTAFILVSEDEILRGKNEWILNTPENLQEAVMRGMTYRSIYSYSSHPNPNEPAPFMFGDLWIVVNDRKNWGDALEAGRRVLAGILAIHSDIEPSMFRYYLDSRGTVYLRIPAPVFGGECGVPNLPLYHRQMAYKLVGY